MLENTLCGEKSRVRRRPMRDPTTRREFPCPNFISLFLWNECIVFSPKIQRLVTPVRLQRRRHLRSLKRRRLESQKEQKGEYEYASFLFYITAFLIYLATGPFSPNVLQRKRPRSLLSRRRTRPLKDRVLCWISRDCDFFFAFEYFL